MTAVWLVLAALILSLRTGPARSASPAFLRAAAAIGSAAAAVVLLGFAGIVVAGPLALVVWAGVRRLQARVPVAPDPELPLLLDVLAAVLRAGRPVTTALLEVARQLDGPSAAGLGRVAARLDLGASPADAWASAGTAPAVRSLARIAARSSESGIRLASALETLARELRADVAAAAQARAQRAGVLAIAPLGLCFLPAFVCLGVVPVIVGIAHDVLIGRS